LNLHAASIIFYESGRREGGKEEALPVFLIDAATTGIKGG
jgi:hypothetical protein